MIENAVEAVTPRPTDEQQDAETATPRPADEQQTAETVKQRPADEQQTAEIAKPLPADEQQDVETVKPWPADEQQTAETVTPWPADEQKDAETVKPWPKDEQQTVETAKPWPTNEQQYAETVKRWPADERQAQLMMLGQELMTEEEQEVDFPENPAPPVDVSSIWAVGRDLVTESFHQSFPLHQSDREPEQVPLPEEQSIHPSYGAPSSFRMDLPDLLRSSPLYSPAVVPSENLTATLDKPSTLKADAVPFVSRSQTNLASLANPIPVAIHEPVPYQLENFCECIAQEESMMEMHQCFGPPISLPPVHYANYAGAKPVEFDGNLPPAMAGMMYQGQGAAYSYMPQMLSASCIPPYPVHSEVAQGSYSLQETIDSDAPVSERNAEEARQVEHLMPAVCSIIGR